MTTKEIFDNYKNFIVSITWYKHGDLIGGGTGFLLNSGHLVTNFHVFESILNEITNGIPCIVKLAFGNNEIEMDNEAVRRTGTGHSSTKNVNDYIILDLRSNLAPRMYESSCLIFSDIEPNIGQKCCLLGYPFGQDHLSIHECIISSIYQRAGIDVYQLDGSVNNGNSGGPLIELETGKIIGIVSRKENGLNELFGELKNAIQNNYKIAKHAFEHGCNINVGGFNVVEAISISFADLDRLIPCIERSANVGIGYAFSINQINKDFTDILSA